MIIDLAAARWARKVSTLAPHLATRLRVMTRDGASVSEIDAVIASDLAERLTLRRARATLIAGMTS
jgi:hypothetical protein